MPDSALPRQFLRYLRDRQPAMVELLRELVLVESPTTERGALDRLARFLGGEWRRRRARIRLLRPRNAGAILRAELAPRTARRTPARRLNQILILGHLDTVYPLGTVRSQPFRVRRGRAYGPGTVDMKSGLVQALFAVDALQAAGVEPQARLVFLFTSDEEMGSLAGRPVIEREARRSRAALVLEPASGLRGALKTARKGGGQITLTVEGRAAHAGVDPEKGVNAIEELARQLVRLRRLAKPQRGLTLNVGVVEGGTRTNVVPDQARAHIDLRIARRADGPVIERRFRRLRPINKRARLIIRGGINRPPLERSPEVARLFRQAEQLARQLGLSLQESSTGGGSDGNFTAALGVPTLDGLGGVGLGLHSPGEFVVIRRMPERAALLASLLLTL